MFLQRRAVSLRRLVSLMGFLPTLVGAEDSPSTAQATDAAAQIVLDQCRRASFDSSTYWTSQPGAMRTFNRSDGSLRAMHKLYSASELVINDLARLEIDRPADWAERPTHFVDLNEPSDVGGALVYPIADPRSDAEGYSFNPAAGSNPLPFPVSWLYLTQDGTLGPLDTTNRFVPMLHPHSGRPTAAGPENPIVARIAWWADDATCKININTASEGVFWDSPRCDTTEERSYGKFQPARGEWQRDMGHPAAVCLSSVLFPGYRLHLPGTTSLLEPLPLESARLLWRATPGIPDAGSQGGTLAVDHSSAGGVEEPVLARHTSAADLAATADLPDAARTRAERSGFFLTAHNRAPDTTRDGLPRVSMWPLTGSGNGSRGWSSFLASKAAPSPVTFTEIDGLMASVSALHYRGTRVPMAVRSDPGRRTGELNDLESGSNYKLATTLLASWLSTAHRSQKFGSKYGVDKYSDSRSLLAAIIDYLRQTNLSQPGMHESVSFARRNIMSGYPVNPLCWVRGVTELQARILDATDPFPKGIGALPVVTETAIITSLRNVHRAGSLVAGGTFYGDNQRQAVLSGPSFDHYEIEVGLLVETFSPVQSSLAQSSSFSYVLGGYSGFEVARRIPNTSIGIAGTDFSIASMTLSGRPLAFPGPNATRSTTISRADSSLPSDWIGSGGTLGTRYATTLIAFKPILISLLPGEPPPDFSFSGSPTLTGSSHLRLFGYDSTLGPNVSGSPDIGNLLRVIPLAFPEIQAGAFALPLNDPDPLPLTDPAATNGPAAGKGTRLARSRGTGGGLYGSNGLIHLEHDIVQSLVPNHGDFRLLTSKVHSTQGHTLEGGSNGAREHPVFVAHPNYGILRIAHGLSEPLPAQNRAIRVLTPYTHPALLSRDDGYFDSHAHLPGSALALDLGFRPDYPIKPWASPTDINLIHPLSPALLTGGAISGGLGAQVAMSNVFVGGRYDETMALPERFLRGPASPDLTGDFDNGFAATLDGPYINAPDLGDARAVATGGTPYFDSQDQPWVENSGTFSPYRHVPSAMMLGSLPTGVMSNVPWQTLLFRPDAARGTSGAHYGSTGWPDHLMADFFRMPVVKPSEIVDWNDPESSWKPSDAFSTEGRINMNYAIVPFTHLRRTTALHALFKSQKLLAIPDVGGAVYKSNAGDQPWRHHIDTAETLRQWDARFDAGDVFHTASELAEQWLVPEGVRLEDVPAFWTSHRLTGDNSKERPYATLYPHLTTRSLTYDLHIVTESIVKASGAPADQFVPGVDTVGPRVRRTITVNGRVDPRHPSLPNYARAGDEPAGVYPRPLDSLLTWTATADSVLSIPDEEPTWQSIEVEPLTNTLVLAWASSHGQSCQLETSSDFQTWTSQGAFRAGEWVDTQSGTTRLNTDPLVTSVRLPLLAGSMAVHARLRWSPPVGGQAAF